MIVAPQPAIQRAALAEMARGARSADRGERLAIARVADARSIAALRAEWEELLCASAAPSFFLTWQWLYTWIETAGARLRPELLTFRRRGRLVAIAPFVRSSRTGALREGSLGRAIESLCFPPSLRFMGDGRVGSDDLDLIVRAGEEQAVIAAVAARLGDDPALLELRRLPRSSAIAEVAGKLVAQGWTLRQKPPEVCPVIDLEGVTWDGYVDGLGRSHRQNLRRRLRQLDQRFRVELQRVERAEEIDGALDVLVDLHHARWDQRGGSDAFDAELEGFHRRLARRALARGWLRLFVLRLDGVPAAALYGFRYRDRFLFYQSGFDPALARHSVGLAMMAMTIRSAIEEGARAFDLLHGAERYKFHWAGATRTLEHFELHPPSRLALRRRLRDTVRSAGAPA
jgi:CelD/BcsL family acetyltransferase involved in cellulose biosynthesis